MSINRSPLLVSKTRFIYQSNYSLWLVSYP